MKEFLIFCFNYSYSLENKKEIRYRARRKQWSGKQFKQKNNRRQNRIAYNHGKHRKK